MKTTTPIKYAGADWVSKSWSYPRVTSISDLGIRVSNVLGQTFQGIYHIQRDFSLFKPNWAADDLIQVRLYSYLSTFDSPCLTLLYLCCEAAHITVQIAGRAKGYLLLNFTDKYFEEFTPIPEDKPLSVPAFMVKHGFFVKPGKIKWRHTNDQGITIDIGFSTGNFSIVNLKQLVIAAHQHCIRLQIEGLSPGSVQMHLSQRTRDGVTWQRHPTWEDHKEILREYWDIDY